MIYALCSGAQNNHLQISKIDSLREAYRVSVNDSVRCEVLRLLLDVEIDDSLLVIHMQEYAKVLKRNLYKKKSTQQTMFFASHFAEYFHSLAIIANVEGRPHEAVINFEKAIRLREILKEKKKLSESYNSIGVVFKNQADLKTALFYYNKSLLIRKELEDKKGMVTSLNNIARIYESQGDYRASVKGYFETLKIAKEIGDEDGMSLALNNIGYTFKIQKKYDSALYFYRHSLKIRKETQNWKGTAQTLNNIGSVYEAMNNNDSALFYIKQSNDLYMKTKDAIGYATSLNNIGNIYKKMGRLKEAGVCNKLSMQEALRMKNPDVIRRAANLGYEIALDQREYKTALQQYYLMISMRDSVNNMQNQKLALKQQMQSEFEKRKAVSDAEHKAQLMHQQLHAEKEQQKQKFILYSIAGILMLVLIFTFLLWNRFRVIRQQKILIEQKEKETQRQNEIILHQKLLVEEKQREIVDSIMYARRIQKALITSEFYINKQLNRIRKG
jgi:tetratricopeptide (TPR) repeat protein